MSIILQILDIIALLVPIFDTLGFVRSELSRSKTEESQKEYKRLLFTWIFYFGISKFVCFTCCAPAFLASVIYLLGIFAKLFITLPICNGSQIAYTKIVEEQLFLKIIHKLTKGSVNTETK